MSAFQEHEVTQAGLEILIILGFIDGCLVEQEIEVISKFYQDKYGNIEDVHETIKTIKCYSLQQMLSELESSAQIIKDNLPREDRLELLKFADKIIFADHSFHENEVKCFNALSTMWELKPTG